MSVGGKHCREQQAEKVGGEMLPSHSGQGLGHDDVLESSPGTKGNLPKDGGGPVPATRGHQCTRGVWKEVGERRREANTTGDGNALVRWGIIRPWQAL